MCCLKNEQETYEELNSNLPNVGDYVTTPEKLKGEVSSVNVLRQLVKVIVTLDGDEKEIREYPVAILIDTGMNSGIYVAQHNGLPQEPIPPNILVSSLTPI